MSFTRDHHPRHRFIRWATSTLAAYAIALLATPTGCGIDNSVVGGECAVGYTQCGLVCIDTAKDPGNCGGCGVACSVGTCSLGKCDPSADSGRKDPSRDAAGDTGKDPGDANSGDNAVDDRVTPHDSTAAGDAPSEGQGHERSTTVDGGADSPSPQDGTTSDVMCASPKSDCAGVCVDEATDPNNCGACGKFCPSGICKRGTCKGSTEGDIVVIGHDYNSYLSTLTAPRLVTNAVFLPTTDPVRVLSFERYADPVSVANVKSILNTEASRTGRRVSYTVSTSDGDIPTELTIASFDVLFVYDQEAAMPGVLGPLGSSWAKTLGVFTGAGGVIVSLDGAAGTTKEMPAFDTKAGLLAIGEHTAIASGTPLEVAAPGDAIGHGVSSPYQAEPGSVYFTTSEPNGGDVTYVVEDTTPKAMPVVVHKAVP
jgi:hypothetical protein